MYPQDSTTNKGRFNGVGLGGQGQPAPSLAPVPPSTALPQRDVSAQHHSSASRAPDAIRDEVSDQDKLEVYYSQKPKPQTAQRTQLVAERKAPPPPRAVQPSPAATETKPSSAATEAIAPPIVRSKPSDPTAQPAPAPTPPAPARHVEKRISTMNEAQIMDKLRSVVSADDPSTMYAKIKKVGQG